MRSVMSRARAAVLVFAVLGAGRAGPAWSVTAEEFAALEPEQALQLPVVEALEVFGWREREFVFVLENALIDLRYLYRRPSGRASEQLTDAVKAFQKQIGREPTGILLVSEFLELMQRGNELWQSPIYPGPAFVSQSDGLVWAEGTWSDPGADEPDPIQTTSLRCYREAGLCSMVTAKLIMSGADERWFHAAAADLALQPRDWKVTRWSAQRIDAEDRSALCVAYTLSIDLDSERVVMQSRPTGAERCADPAEASRTYTLVSGFAVASRYWEARQLRVHALRSAAFRRLVERIQKNQ
jgi:hypothetical protein